jgi:hypothetical protein
MNERIKELAEQCGVRFNNGGEHQMMWIEKFAELVRADEREACVKIALRYEPTERNRWVRYAADEMRARGEK